MGIQKPYLTREQVAAFDRDGYLVVPGWYCGDGLQSMQASAKALFAAPSPPWELESQLGYPGAPKTYEDGSATPRRLLGAFKRSHQWQAHAIGPRMQGCLRALFSEQAIFLSQAHHNCLMTKTPKFSSDTGWHQDMRYWAFQKPELISAWLALGYEQQENGGLVVIPGSHKHTFDAEQFDEKLFFKADIVQNQPLIECAQPVDLNPGDMLFFHSRLLHRASRNYTSNIKLSLVFTYYAGSNAPVPDSRSASQPGVELPCE